MIKYHNYCMRPRQKRKTKLETNVNCVYIKLWQLKFLSLSCLNRWHWTESCAVFHLYSLLDLYDPSLLLLLLYPPRASRDKCSLTSTRDLQLSYTWSPYSFPNLSSLSLTVRVLLQVLLFRTVSCYDIGVGCICIGLWKHINMQSSYSSSSSRVVAI